MPIQRGPEKRDLKKTELGRTNERLYLFLKNPNLSKAKRKRLEGLLKKLTDVKKKVKESTLKNINRQIERITGKERIKMMKELVSKNYKAISRGNLSSLPRLFVLLKSDRVPIKYRDLAINRLGNKLYVKDKTGKYTFDFKANSDKKWEIWYQGEKVSKTRPTKALLYKKHAKTLRYSNLAQTFISGKDKDKQNREDSFHCSEQDVYDAKLAKPKPTGEVATKGPKEVLSKNKQLVKDLDAFMQTTSTSAGPLPKSLIAYLKKNVKRTPNALSEKYLDKEGTLLHYGVYFRSKIINGRRVYQVSINQGDKDRVRVRTEVVKYWPVDNKAVAQQFKKSAPYIAWAKQFKPKPTIKVFKPKKLPKAVVEQNKAEYEAYSGLSAKDLKAKAPKPGTVEAKRYAKTLLTEVSKLAKELKNPRTLYSKWVKQELSKKAKYSRAEKQKVYNKVARGVSVFKTRIENLEKDLTKGKNIPIPQLRASFNRALKDLPQGTVRDLYAKRFRRFEGPSAQA